MAEAARCRLFPATGQSCGPVGVGAVTGATEDDVCAAIVAAAGEDGQAPKHLLNSNFRHQARAVELLAGSLFDPRTGLAVSAKSFPQQVDQFAPAELVRNPTIPEFIRSNESPDVLLCLAEHSTGERHTVALEGKRFYDCNTQGEIVASEGIHPNLAGFRVITSLAVRRKGAYT
jgi:hypothetical protein